jgi:hypothetical protein
MLLIFEIVPPPRYCAADTQSLLSIDTPDQALQQASYSVASQAEALWGLSAIPAVWLEKLAWFENTADRGARLMAAAG